MEGPLVTAQLEARAFLYISDPRSVTMDLGDTFVATSRELMPHHQFSIGRRNQPWSEGDELWALGMWSSRFTWDPLRPKRDGLTGAFYNYRSKKWKVTAFASPMVVPDRSFPVRAENGTLSSPNPDFIPPYSELLLQGFQEERVGIRYAIEMPDLGELLLKPGGAVSVMFGDSSGPWALASGGVLPSHQLDLAAEFALDPQRLVVDTVIHPRVYHHRLLTFEGGFNFGESSDPEHWSLFASVTQEVPLLKEPPGGWVSQPIGPAWIGQAGAKFASHRWFSVEASLVAVQERKPAPNEDQAAVALPSRFSYTRATRMSGKYTRLERLVPEVQWTHDFANPADQYSLDLTYAVPATRWGSGWTVGLGADLFSARIGEGFYGPYAGNDRVRGRIAYVF